MTGEECVLICTVGLPRSGKSTWAHCVAREPPIVNPDAIRYALHGQRYQVLAEPFVWAIAKVMVRALFGAGHRVVILDATNTTRKRRDEWQSGPWLTVFQVMPFDEELSIERAVLEGDVDIVPIIRKMAKQYEPLDDGEESFNSGR